ncbi:MAG: PHP domain-containing protein [Planctomycetes bacterium]|nr:PHP domain-containing protein [Planctomycetota bacterium]
MSAKAGELKVYRCAVHVHTTMDDGEMPMEHVIKTAEKTGVDVLVCTGHNHLMGADPTGWQGMHGKVFVVMGTELTTREGDHILSFGLTDRVASRLLTTPDMLKLLDRLGTTKVIAHPQGRPKHYMTRLKHVYKHWGEKIYDGVEIWSYMHDWIEELSITKLPSMCREPDNFITGPNPEVIARWDDVARERVVAGVGSLDTHGKQLPFRLGNFFEWARRGILPYDQNFAAFSSYTMAPPLSGSTYHDAAAIVKSIKQARLWVCHDSLHSGREFRYHAMLDGAKIPTGEEVKYRKGVQLNAESPVDCEMRVYSRGKCVCEAEGRSLGYSPEGPGEYRLCAYLGGRPWILTNHIYLR